MGRWHAKAAEHAGAAVAGVFDLNASAAADLARPFGAVSGTTLDELLALGRYDALHLCTPLSSHFALARRAIEAGLHLLVEKPLVPTSRETEELHRAAAERGVVLCPVHQFPFQPGVAEAHKRIAQLGSLRHFEATFLSAGGTGKSEAALDQIVADILPHPLALFCRFAPSTLHEVSWQVVHPAPGEFRAIACLGDTTYQILISMSSRPTATGLRLYCTEGSLHVDLFHGFCVEEPGAVSRLRKIAHPFDLATRTLAAAATNLARRAARAESAYPGLRPLVHGFYEAVRGKASCPISPEESIAIARARDRLIASFSPAAVSS